MLSKASGEKEILSLKEGEELKKYVDKLSEKLKVVCKIEENNGICTINLRGTGAHAAYPESGNNALTAMLEILAAIPFAKSAGFEKLCAVKIGRAHV